MSKPVNLAIKWRLLKIMCLKISIVTHTKSDSTLKYHLKRKGKKNKEKPQKCSNLFDFSLKKIRSPEGSVQDAINVPACFTQQ